MEFLLNRGLMMMKMKNCFAWFPSWKVLPMQRTFDLSYDGSLECKILSIHSNLLIIPIFIVLTISLIEYFIVSCYFIRLCKNHINFNLATTILSISLYVIYLSHI